MLEKTMQTSPRGKIPQCFSFPYWKMQCFLHRCQWAGGCMGGDDGPHNVSEAQVLHGVPSTFSQNCLLEQRGLFLCDMSGKLISWSAVYLNYENKQNAKNGYYCRLFHFSPDVPGVPLVSTCSQRPHILKRVPECPLRYL